MTSFRRTVVPGLLAAAALTAGRTGMLSAQGGGRGAQSGPMAAAAQLDLAGRTAEARAALRPLIDSTSDPAARAAVHRAMAMTHAFDGDCVNTVREEDLVIAYWKSREKAEPQNAFYQEGEMADEAARVCIDAGDFVRSEQLYREGYARGMLEPAPRTHPASLWAFRLAHALGRLDARRGDRKGAMQQVAAARQALAGDSATATQQARFLPYLTGYVALYTDDLATAESEFKAALAMPGNERDPFMHCLLAMTYERLGNSDAADAMYRQAYAMATANNPPAAFVRPFVRKKLGLSGE